MIPKAEEWTVVIAESQSQGRGKPGTSWYSPSGGLYFSVILKPRKNPPDLAPLTQLAAKAVSRALHDHNPHIKPPNDILIGGKKVCGILTEKTADGLIIGIGLNININEFPAGLDAGSISGDKETVLEEILRCLKEEYLKYLGVGI